MDNRPIGIFDSGLGGLTCIPYLKDRLPNERIIYFGDTARTPYGSKAISTIKGFVNQICDFLVESDVKMIVIACNTVSATCLDMLRDKYPDISIVGIINPAVAAVLKNCSLNDSIGIIGTKVTVESGAYRKAISEGNPEMKVFQKPCPAFVPLIEEGILQNDIMDLTIEYYMNDFILENRVNTLVIGCTHYPLIQKSIKRKFPNLRIINPSYEIVDEIFEILRKNYMFAEKNSADDIYYASDLSENFQNMIDRIFKDSKVKTQFKNLDI